MRAAAELLASGWRPADQLGQVLVPIGEQRGGLHLTHDLTWQAMALMQLQAEGKVR